MLTEREIGEVAERLEGRTPLETLRWAVERFPSRVTFGTGFGVEGCVLIDLIARHGLPIDLFTLDTGLLFPETYELWQQLETRYGLTIRAIHPKLTVDAQAAAHGAALWSRDPDRCCGIRKVAPLAEALKGFDAWVTAIRREQTAARAAARVVEWDARWERTKINPLVHWSRGEVWSYVVKNEVPYNLLHDYGYPSIGCWPCTSPVAAGEDSRAGRWRGTAKTECGLHVGTVELAAVDQEA